MIIRYATLTSGGVKKRNMEVTPFTHSPRIQFTAWLSILFYIKLSQGFIVQTWIVVSFCSLSWYLHIHLYTGIKTSTFLWMLAVICGRELNYFLLLFLECQENWSILTYQLALLHSNYKCIEFMKKRKKRKHKKTQFQQRTVP